MLACEHSRSIQFNMDHSFNLLSTMSPKMTEPPCQSSKKRPTKLALKKHFRRSSLFVQKRKDLKKNGVDSVIIIESSSSGGSSEDNSSKSIIKIVNKTPVVISDSNPSEESPGYNIKSPVVEEQNLVVKRLSDEKLDLIRNWVEEVNVQLTDLPSDESAMTLAFTELSTISGASSNPNFKQPKTNVAVNSTCVDVQSPRFDELFKKKLRNDTSKKKAKKISTESEDIISNSLSDRNKKTVIEDSFEGDLNIGESLQVRLDNKDDAPPSSPKNSSYSSIVQLESVLNSIYGDSWQKNKDDILPATAPRRNPPQIIRTNPRIVEVNKSNKLLKSLQVARTKTALESPWVKSLKDLCDSDSESDEPIICPRIKLDFDERLSDLQSDGDGARITPIRTTKKTNGSCTFLESLSSGVPISRCDPSARIYRTNFKEHKEELSRKLFKQFNEKIFNGAIADDTPIEWNVRLRGTAGCCYCRRITRRNGAVERTARIALSTKVIDSADRLRDTLVHEMCHAATWIINEVSDGHGAFWKSWASRAMRTFPDLPAIKRCHNYAINYKYTYECTKCGYSFGRHRKSVDLDVKCCGRCKGRFEVFLNKTSKDGAVKSVIATPKKQPNVFALFVKDNYKIHKTPDLKHADVMRLLGEKFSSLKVNK